MPKDYQEVEPKTLQEMMAEYHLYVTCPHHNTDVDELFDTLVNTYGNARVEEIIKIAEKMKKEGLEDVLEWLPEHGYNEALDELIEAIKK